MTDKELRDLAVAALEQTTVTYQRWKNTAYQDITKTKWWQAFNLLSQIGLPQGGGAALPVGPFTVKNGGGTIVSFPDCFVRTDQATTISKKQVERVTGYGVGSMQFQPPSVQNTGYTTITDCIATDVKAAQPGSMGGTGEACFWFGNRTNAARLYAARAGWMGAFVGNRCHESVIEDFTVEECPVGVYVEHVTHDVTFKRLSTSKIADAKVAGGSEPGGILAARSVSVEWWYGGQGSYNLTFEDCDIYCPAGADPRCGVYVGPGTYGMRFLGVRFWGPGVGVRLPTVRVNNGPDAVFDGCVFENDGQHVVYHNLPIG